MRQRVHIRQKRDKKRKEGVSGVKGAKKLMHLFRYESVPHLVMKIPKNKVKIITYL